MPPRVRAPYPQGYPRMMQPPISRGSYPPGYRMGPNMRPPRQSRGGGLLSKILGKGGGNRAGSNPFSLSAPSATSRSAGGGGLMKAFTDPNALNGFLTNTQKVLNTAQQIGPMVQQYGPIVKNLPSLWRLYKGFKDLPSDEEENNKTNTPKESETNKTIKKSSPNDIEETSFLDEENITVKGQSVPKLYI
jgi:hypothetical protein